MPSLRSRLGLLPCLLLPALACSDQRSSSGPSDPEEDARVPVRPSRDAASESDATEPSDDPDGSIAPSPDAGTQASDTYALPDGPRVYVSPSGSDAADGSEDKPLRTVDKALERLQAGTIVLRAGRYGEQLNITHVGTSEADTLTLAAMPGELVELVAPAKGDVIRLTGAAYVRVLGLTLRGTGKQEDASGLRVVDSGHHLELAYNDVSELRGESAMGITVYGKDGVGIRDIRIHHNVVHDCEPAPSEALVVNGNVQRFEITDNEVRDVNNIGIDVIGGESWLSKAYPQDGLVARNRVARANSSYDGSAACIYVDGASRITIAQNSVRECDFGIEIGAENAGVVATEVVVRDNFVSRSFKGGIIFGGYDQKRGRVRGAVFTHNSLFQNGRPGEKTRYGFAGEAGGELIVQYASDCRITNNVLSGAAQTDELYAVWGTATGMKVEHNLFHRAGGAAELPSGTGNVEGDPGFRDPSKGDLHLTDGSRARGKAVADEAAGERDIDGDLRPRTGADLGADQH